MRPIVMGVLLLCMLAVFCPMSCEPCGDGAEAAVCCTDMNMCSAKYKVNDLVELQGGARLFVVGVCTKCKVACYSLSINKGGKVVLKIPQPDVVKKI